MKKLIALLLALALVLALASCGSGSSSTTDTASADSASAEASAETAEEAPAEEATPTDTAASGDTSLVIGTEGEPTNLGPSGLIGNTAGIMTSYAIYEHLWYYDADGTFHNRLGESYEFDNDAETLTIHLRADGQFSDGTAITAEDVLFSINHYNSDAKTLGNFNPDTSSVVDDTTLIIGMVDGANDDATLEQLEQVCIISKSYTEDYTNDVNIYTTPLTSGPYTLAQPWTTGSALELVKNAAYWDAANTKYENVTINFVGEETTRYLSYKTGEYDICYLTESDNIDTAKSDGFNVYTQAMQSVDVFLFDTEHVEEFTNQNLRLALCYSVDMPTIIANVCGSAYVPATSLLPAANWAYQDMSYEYDPELALDYYNKYVEETGNETTEFSLVIQEGLKADIAEAMQYYFAQLPGVTMNIETVDNATFFARLISENFTVTMSTFSGSGEPCVILDQCMSTSMAGAPKTSGEMQAAMDAACFSNEDHDTRAAMFAEVQAAYHDFGKCIPMYESTLNFAENGSQISAAAVCNTQSGGLVIFALQ